MAKWPPRRPYRDKLNCWDFIIQKRQYSATKEHYGIGAFEDIVDRKDRRVSKRAMCEYTILRGKKHKRVTDN